MFRTKSDVDRYASKIINKNQSFQKLSSSEGLRIARLYFDIKEYESAQNYLASSLSENPNDPLGWKLMGEIHEYSENKDWSKAIDCYSKYYKLDSQACAILLKICNCFKNLDRNFDKAITWIEETEKVYPYSKQVIELKEKIWNSKGKYSESIDWEGYLRRAIKDNGNDEELKLKLVQCFIEQKKYQMAIEFILKTEIDNLNILSLSWYENSIQLTETILVETCQQNVHLVYLMLLKKKIFLLIEQREIGMIQESIKKFDLAIRTYEMNKDYDKNYKIDVLNEIKSQFIFQCGLFVMKDQDNEIDYFMLSNICFIISSFKSKPNQIKRQSKQMSSKLDDYLTEFTNQCSCLRYTLIGHWLKRISFDDQMVFIDEVKKFCKNKNVKQILLSKINGGEICDEEGFFELEKDFEIPNSEYLFIDFLALDYSDKFYIPNYETLSYGVDNLNLACIESISVLDLMVFLYSTLVQCYSFNGIKNPKTCSIMPYYLQKDLCTNEQAAWWLNCIKFIEFKNQQQSTKIMQQLNHGVEIIRLKRVQSKQLNIQIGIKTALYLQNLSNVDNQRSIENCLIFTKSDLNEMISIEEKSKYLDLYATHYWCYISNYLKITFNLEDDEQSLLNDSVSSLSINKRKTNLFFDINDNFDDLFKNDHFNRNIYKLACLYVSNRKLEESDYDSVKDLIKEIKFDKINFSDKVEFKAANYLKKQLIPKILSLAGDNKELVELSGEKLKESIDFIEKFEASLAPVEIKIQLTEKQQYLSPVKKSPQKQIDEHKNGEDSSFYKSLTSNQSDDSLSMKTANETLNSTTTTTSFEITKEEEEDSLNQVKKEEEEEQKTPPSSTSKYQQKIIDKLNETKSIKINLYHDILKNQFETINSQRFQLSKEMTELKILISNLQNI